MDRRNFIAGAAAPLFVPASAFGANDRISYGVIATGGRGSLYSGSLSETRRAMRRALRCL